MSGGQHVCEASPGDMLGDDVRHRLEAPVVDGEHTREAECGSSSHLLLETLLESLVASQVPSQDLDGNPSAQREVVSRVDPCVRPLPDQFQQPVAAAQEVG